MVLKVPIAGGNVMTLATAQDGPHGISVDATSIYELNEIGGTVMKLAN